ncbi:MAG: response regulator transcription factor [Candidatus Izemoplasmatales bacterium]|nr:response regulator transcription factor [Candidatus Izemoplasmatales bacterium]
MRILIVEDERRLNDVMHDYLMEAHPEAHIDQCFDGDDALEMLGEQEFDIVLLDVMLPGTDGFEIAREIRKTSNMPILILSALGDEENQLRGFDLGIDDYVKKPYSPKLVVKKVDAILARVGTTNSGMIQKGILSYDEVGMKIFVEGEEVILNKKEWELFHLFIHNESRVLSRETLLNKIWGYDYFGDERTLDTHIRRLRKKLGNASHYIKTVHRTGYMFEVA